MKYKVYDLYYMLTIYISLEFPPISHPSVPELSLVRRLPGPGVEMVGNVWINTRPGCLQPLAGRSWGQSLGRVSSLQG